MDITEMRINFFYGFSIQCNNKMQYTMRRGCCGPTLMIMSPVPVSEVSLSISVCLYILYVSLLSYSLFLISYFLFTVGSYSPGPQNLSSSGFFLPIHPAKSIS
jgi:hypothetical protein